MTNATLLVPLHVDAYVVNQPVLDNQPMRRWTQVYANVPEFSSSEPDFTDISKGIATDPGVYLFWTLPTALRHGNQNLQTRQIEFPLVPNRWLIVRTCGPADNRKAVSWVVESDAPGDSSSSTYPLDPSIIKAWQSSKDPNRLAAGKRMDAKTGALVADVLGQVFSLKNTQSNQSWTERGIKELFVKAVAPGNPLFSAYQPHCRNVFSFHDQLDVPHDNVSYLVVGWYSNAAEDPLHKCQQNKPTGTTAQAAYQELLSQCKWTVTEVAEDLEDLRAQQAPITDSAVATSSLYHGMALRIPWEAQQKPKTISDEDMGIHVAVGNNSIDAFKALTERQLHDRAKSDPQVAKLLNDYPNVAQLLEAFQYDMLNVLDDPNGDAVLDLKIRQQWFGSKPGGYRWSIVDASDSGAEKSEAERAREAKQEQWLADLNQDQANFDAAVKHLQATQWWLYATWCKKVKLDQQPSFAWPAGLTSDQFDKALAPRNDRSYDHKSPPSQDNIFSVPLAIHSLQTRIEKGLQPKLPTPTYANASDTPERALANGIEAFANLKRKRKQLADDRLLKAVTAPRYWNSNDPVVLITGAKNSHRIKPNEALPCRLSSQVIDAIESSDGKTVVTSEQIKKVLPGLELTTEELATAIQGDFISAETAGRFAVVIEGLLNEFLLLDPTSAGSLEKIDDRFTPEFISRHAAKNYRGVLPALIPGEWTQPWNPLFLKWTADWHAIDFQHWKFDGTDYRYDGKAQSSPRAFGGDLLLTPQTNYVFHERLRKFVDTNPESGTLLQKLDKLIDSIDSWDLVSQSLVGFSEQVAIRDSRTNRGPDQYQTFDFDDNQTKTMAELIGEQYDCLPYLKTTDDTGARDFSGVRQGQVCLTYLAIYDAFGQVLEAVGDSGLKSAAVFEPILSTGLVPDAPIETQNSQRFIQLPPRLVQHSRLNFRLQDSADDHQFVDIHPEANPVAGWLLPNHLDGAIGLYDHSGVSLGELRLLETANGAKTVGWQAAPHSEWKSLEDIEGHAPHLGKVIAALQAKGTVAFENLFQVIDKTLWTVDPLGARGDQNLSILIGRPLALVRAHLQFELDGPPIVDCGWQATFDPPVPDFIRYDFEIRLGEQELRQDGLIGYYLNDQYDTFHSVHQLERGTPLAGYVKPVKPGNFIPLKFDGKSQAELLMLCDPRASIHAVTGILPVKSLEVPDRFIDSVLRKMEISFSIGPLLTQIQKNMDDSAEAAGFPQVIKVPLPAERPGKWSWWEKTYGAGKEQDAPPYGLSNVDDRAHLKSDTKSLREGCLQLQIKLGQNS